MKKIEEY